MRQLPPIRLKNYYWADIEKEIQRIFDLVIYIPLARAAGIPTTEIINNDSALYRAIGDGTVWYVDGQFKGQFNSTLTKELRAMGATYNIASRTWSLPHDLIPPHIRMAQAHADGRYAKMRANILQTLDDMHISSIDNLSNTPEQYKKTIDWLEGDFQKSLSAISIKPKLTETQRDIIAKEWGENLDKYIKNWTAENILGLRNKVQGNVFEGKRSSELIRMMQDNYGISQRKARFLARQETSLLTAKFRETRSRDVGSSKYRWSTSHDERVRHDHAELNGKVYFWDLPPVTNRRTGKRNNPGEDFGCRCLAIALID